MESAELELLCRSIRIEHRERMFAMAQRKRADNALGAFLRRREGWSMKLPEAEREAIAKRVRAAIKAGEQSAKTGEEQTDPLYLRCEALIDAAIEARGPFNRIENEALLRMKRAVRKLPVWTGWAKDILGIGEASVGTIIGECGNLNRYPTHSKLWKRLSLAVMNGRRQGNPGADATKADWMEHKYSKETRSLVWIAGDSFVKTGGPYRAVYDARKAYELAKAAERGQVVEPASARTKNQPDKFMSAMHIHRRAQRYAEKKMLRDLHREWTKSSRAIFVLPERAMDDLPSDASGVAPMPPHAPFSEAAE